MNEPDDFSQADVVTAYLFGAMLNAQGAAARLPEVERLRYWKAITAWVLRSAEASVGPDGRMAIVQCMRALPPRSDFGSEVSNGQS